MPEGVVGALRSIHHALRPDGILLDLHPEPQAATVTICSGSHSVATDPLSNATDRIGKICAARAVLARVVDEGYFALEAQDVFKFESHFPSIDDWYAFRVARGRTAEIDATAVERARQLATDMGGELRICEHIRASRLRRLER